MFSSNNPNFRGSKSGYFFCENDKGFHIKPANVGTHMSVQKNFMKSIQFFDMHARFACENSPAFIPTSKLELNSALKVINDSMQDDLPRKLRNVSTQ